MVLKTKKKLKITWKQVVGEVKCSDSSNKR